MAWIGAAISAVGSLASSKGSADASKASSKMDKETALASIAAQGNQQRISSAYEMELNDYYAQLSKQRKRNARGKMYDPYSGRPSPVREALVPEKAPGVPISKPEVTVGATYKKPSLWDRLTKPSLDPLGVGFNGQQMQPRGDQLTPRTTTPGYTTREPLGGG